MPYAQKSSHVDRIASSAGYDTLLPPQKRGTPHAVGMALSLQGEFRVCHTKIQKLSIRSCLLLFPLVTVRVPYAFSLMTLTSRPSLSSKSANQRSSLAQWRIFICPVFVLLTLYVSTSSVMRCTAVHKLSLHLFFNFLLWPLKASVFTRM